MNKLFFARYEDDSDPTSKYFKFWASDLVGTIMDSLLSIVNLTNVSGFIINNSLNNAAEEAIRLSWHLYIPC